MDPTFELFPESASSVSDKVDAVYIFLLVVAGFFTALICVLILGFGIHYRRGSDAPRANPPQSKLLELAWAVVPFILTMVMFGWGAAVYYEIVTPPPGAREIEVVGKQWMFRLQHPEGPSELNTLHVAVGQPVKLRMISEDVIHSFYVPAFRVKQDVLPGYYTSMWFQPTKPGEYHLFCAEYCGTEHSLMRGKVVVMSVPDYADWISGETGEPPHVVGARLFERYRCGSCHKPDGSGTGPKLAGIFGKDVPLAGGGMILADEQYLRDSILDPRKHIVAGYQSLMPSFGDDLNEAAVMQLIAYLKTMDGSAQENAPGDGDAPQEAPDPMEP